MDFEIFDVLGIEGFGAGAEPEQRFAPFYASTDANWHRRDQGYYVLRREPRVLSARQQRAGPRSSYVGSEAFVSLVDAAEAPFAHSLRQLQVTALVTNRDLPLQMPLGMGRTDFTLESGAPLAAVRCVAGPTRPRTSPAFGEQAWRLLSHLSLNYLSIVDADEGRGASALRELLSLYVEQNDVVMQKQIEGVASIATRPLVSRLPQAGPIALGRGLEITLTLDDDAFHGTGSFLLGSVLEEFFARQVSLNSFTATVLRSTQRGEIMRWPPRTGRRPLL
jgi:type VI secretion system protein ImpG